MKLITHNILTSKVLKQVVNGYPLKLNATKTEIKKSDYQPDFINRMMKKIDYKALYEAAQTLNCIEGLPPVESYSEEETLKNEDILKKLHHVLLEVEVMEGELECPETGRKFPIKNGIPNMLVTEDE